ncbi:ELWxxDGT repeat protein [Lacipirellula limnantheis]|uniref:Hyalin n=1 Tax=Lacipirellula limnantheis TaxID=2528024 RepID=A0A517U436_9BACT|nr:ELWxxDGT repeat protein [Lacipirellula limnantheis]QDT75388.1 hypothetical protein I41_45980 [Lacipirellula limnantheis]
MPRHSRLNRSTPATSGRSLRLEPLEDRRVLSVTLEMLTDVGSTPHSGDSNPYGFVQVGDLTYFSTRPGSPPASTTETWVTNGTTNATRLLSEVLPGDLLVGGVVGNVAGTLYFTASLPDLTGYKLWQWGGIGSEPTPVLSATGQSLSIATPIVEVGGVWYFGALATSVGVGAELWRTDGTQAGTYQVKEIRPGPVGGFNLPNAGRQPTLFNVSGRLMFIANDGTHGSELWTSDGTEAGTVIVKDIQAGKYNGIAPSSFYGAMAAVVGDLLYFSAATGPSDSELWRSDGTDAGTYRVKDIRLGNQGSTPQHLTNAGGALYFAANDGATGNELWKSDGTEAGTVLVKDIQAGASGSGPFDLTEMNGLLYFGASAAVWCSDGTEAGTTLLFGDQPIPNFIQLPMPLGSLNETYANLDQIVNLNGTLYFPGRDSYGSQLIALWKYDGAGNATRVLSNNTAGVNSFNTFETIHFLTAAGDKLYFAGDSFYHGNEPWISDGTTAGTRLLKDVTGMDTDSSVSGLTNANGTLRFIANTGVSSQTPPRGWWTTDGTIAGTTSYAANTGKMNGYSFIGSAGGLTFFKTTNSSSDNDWELWRTDGTAAGTLRAKDIRPGAESGLGSGSTGAVEMNGFLYFRANDGIHGFELWRSDGTEAGTTMVADVFPGDMNGVSNVNFTPMANVGGTLYFVANDGASGNALWRTDGTAAGTNLVRTFNTWTPRNLYNVNGTLFFGAGHDDSGLELWKSDGTEAGTVMVKDIAPGNSLWHVDPPGFANIGDTIYFIANDGVTGPEIWKSDGTAEGTQLVKDIRSDGVALLSQFTVVGNTLYFYANDGVHGSELWKSDGTEAGTTLVKDIQPGASSGVGGIANPVNVGGILYFSATDGVNGAELWRSDGTEAGTYMVRNINAVFSGAGGSDLRSLTNVNGRLYFAANDGVHGSELWMLSPDDAAMAAGDYDQNDVTDGADFLKWQRAFGSADVTNDGDNDGTVGSGDLDAWEDNFGAPESASPSSGVAAAVAAILADEEAGTDGASTTTTSQGSLGSAAGVSPWAREAIFAAGDFSLLFRTFNPASEDWLAGRRGRGARR